jgi:hypothetical protein
MVLLRVLLEPLCLTRGRKARFFCCWPFGHGLNLEIPRRQITSMVAPVVSLALDSSRQDTRHGWRGIDRCILFRNRSGVPE